jgi:hypothetical protein
MSWMNEHKRVWRVAVLVLLLMAIAGPWTLDLVFVPSGYSCSAPAIRLGGDYCGIPMSGIWVLAAMTGGLANMVVGLVTGTTVFTGRVREFSFSLLGLLLVLPFLSTLFMILRGDRRCQLAFHVVALSLAVGLGLLLVGMSGYSNLSWVLWGIWLYVGLAASALILELVMLAARRRLGQE